MDMSFLLFRHCLPNTFLNNDLEVGVTKAPDDIDYEVANLKLKAMDIEIDTLSERQKSTCAAGKKELKFSSYFFLFYR